MLRDQDRGKRPRPITRNREREGPVIGQHRLGARAVAMMGRRIAASTSAAVSMPSRAN